MYFPLKALTDQERKWKELFFTEKLCPTNYILTRASHCARWSAPSVMSYVQQPKTRRLNYAGNNGNQVYLVFQEDQKIKFPMAEEILWVLSSSKKKSFLVQNNLWVLFITQSSLCFYLVSVNFL